MNDYEKNKIITLRTQGIMPTKISALTGIPVNTIKSYFKRHKDNLPNTTKCPTCGKNLIKSIGKKNKRFCNDTCRMKYWSSNLDKVNKKAYYTLICENCGKEFKAYGNNKRKYCSRECYVQHFKTI